MDIPNTQKINDKYKLSFSDQQLIFHEFYNSFENVSEALYDRYLSDFIINTGKKNCFFLGHKYAPNLFLKAIELSAFLSEQDEKPSFKCFSEELNFFDKDMDISRFACMYSLLASGSKKSVNLIDMGPYPYKIGQINDTRTESKILRVINLKPNIVISKIVNKLLSHSERKSQKNVFTLGENELVKEIKFYNKKAINFIEINVLLKDIYINTDANYKEYINIVNSVVIQKFDGILEKYKINDDLKRSFCLIISKMLSYQISKLVNSQIAMNELIKNLREQYSCNTALGNGLFGNIGVAIYNSLVKNNVKVVCAEHGLTTGLSKYSKDTINLYEPRTADYILTYNLAASKTFQLSSNENIECIHCGAPYETKRIRHKFIQRLISRNRLKAKGCVVFYASMNLLTNNNRFFPGYPNDEHRYKNEIIILNKLIPQIGKNFIYKQYPSQNYLYKESPYIVAAKKQKNIIISKEEDFRYIRTAADIIITAVASSTLGWCIGADVPLVFLGSKKYHALEDETVWRVFNECFFVINTDNEFWEDEFVNLLNKDIKEILHEWNKKKEKYQKYDEYYFLGMCKNAGQIGSNFIKNLVSCEN